MKIFKEVILRLPVILLLVGSMLPLFETGQAAADGGIIIDHTCTDITQIPESAIEAAKANLHIGYGHTSHGSQITYGMDGLVAFANGGGKGLDLPDDIFAYGNDEPGKLDLEDGDWETGSGWLEDDARYYPGWVNETHEYLDAPGHENVNVLMWAWCNIGGAWNKYAEGTLDDNYLLPMRQLEADYPDVTFVYMTEPLMHAHDADDKAANQMIRDYFNSDPNPNKVLYDWADIESYIPNLDGTYTYLPFAGSDTDSGNNGCYYYDSADNMTPLGDWGVEWQNTHTVNVDWYSCSSRHSQPVAANLKAYAAWWLFARLAGWSGTSGPPADTQPPSVTITSPNGGEERKVDCHYDVTWTATDDVDVTSCNISYSTDNGASYTDIANGLANEGVYSWTIPDAVSTTCLVKVAAGDAAGNWGQDTSNAVFEICACIPGDADDSGVVNALDITKTERIVLELDFPPTEDADANQDTFVNALDITKIEQIISGT